MRQSYKDLTQSYKLKDLTLNWLVSYLSDRHQRVIVSGKTSKWTSDLSGVPEGSLLPQLLVLLLFFVIDLQRAVNSGCLMYVDDV